MHQPRHEIEQLKANWLQDPCWDIEDTEGFEDHYIELKAYRIGLETDIKNIYKEGISDIANNITSEDGLVDPTKVAAYIYHIVLALEETRARIKVT